MLKAAVVASIGNDSSRTFASEFRMVFLGYGVDLQTLRSAEVSINRKFKSASGRIPSANTINRQYGFHRLIGLVAAFCTIASSSAQLKNAGRGAQLTISHSKCL